jgi:hypothetical protein
LLYREVDADDKIPQFLIMLFDLQGADHARYIRNVVEPAELIDGRFEPLVNLQDISHVTTQGQDIVCLGSHIFDDGNRLI